MMGTYEFDTTSAWIQLHSAGNGLIVADAVRMVYVGEV